MTAETGRNEATDCKHEKHEKKVVVVGDWVFDEIWVTGEHRAAASLIGSGHLRALHHHDTSLYGLANAGKTAALLYHDLKKHEEYQIHGIGVWDHEDTDAIKAFLDLGPEGVHQSQYRISRPVKSSCNAELFNLGDLVEEKLKQEEYRCGTMRAIRFYRHVEGRLQHQKRIDWDPPFYKGETVWVNTSEHAILTADDLNTPKLSESVEDASTIVVDDIGRGVISPALVKWLIKKAPKAEWFLSSKDWRPAREPDVPEEQPDWLQELERTNAENVKLLLVPHKAAVRAVEEGDLICWIDCGGPSLEAVKRLDQLRQRFPKAPIVVMPKGLTVLARFFDKEGHDQCLVQTNKDSRTIDGVEGGLGVPITSIFFPTLILCMLKNEPSNVSDALKRALEFTHCWMNREVERIQDSETETDLSKPEVSVNDYLPEKPENSFAKWNQLEWNIVKQRWYQAFRECGIMEKGTGNGDLKNPEHRRIELWRAAIDVPAYVCCVPSRRHAIRLLRRQLILFKTDMRRPRQARGLMAVASPGSGKTHFVKQLAKSHDLAFVHFNITQMLSKADILDCFDTIVTREAQDNQPLLVFFDEINSRINGQHVYDTFLAPIEEGIYVRGGKTFRLPACVWLFAGTEDPSKDPDVSSKGNDFVSRLSLHPINFRPEAGEEADVNTEHVYLGVTLLKQAFPDITAVSEKVLRAFEFLRPDVDVRQVKHLVDSFLEVEHEQVLSRNVPLEYYKELTHPNPSHRHCFDRWWELDEGTDMVMIHRESRNQ